MCGDLFGKRVLADVIKDHQVRRSSWITHVVPNPVTSVLVREKRQGLHGWGPQKPGVRKGSPYSPGREHGPQTPGFQAGDTDFGFLAYTTVRKEISTV